MSQPLAHIVTMVSDGFRLPYPPLHGMCPTQDPVVSLGISQAQLGSSGWREAFLALLPAYPGFFIWKSSPAFSPTCQSPPGAGRVLQGSCQPTGTHCTLTSLPRSSELGEEVAKAPSCQPQYWWKGSLMLLRSLEFRGGVKCLKFLFYMI